MGIATFILASASPARRRLLQGVGIDPVVRVSHFDESQIQLSDPAALVKALALRKAETVVSQLDSASLESPVLVMGCDSVLAIKGEIHGKPADAAEAVARWQRMRRQIGELYTGHALLDVTHQRQQVRCQVTRVYFGWVSDRQIAAYVATGEPLTCAGCFALEGKGGSLIDKLEGCHSNVIGLSLPLLRQMLDELGYDLADFWETT
ncbi:MAG: septum formation inhibitor Maf [Scytolyngbya sp. HA4215-MV1]|jgi:septum formation protein|nr:septum formation inhibitor Maf [Scytolyngbya sp. HA4215-MV1]